MYKITVITKTGQIVPEIPCEDYDNTGFGHELILLIEDGSKEVARFYEPQGYIVKEDEDNG